MDASESTCTIRLSSPLAVIRKQVSDSSFKCRSLFCSFQFGAFVPSEANGALRLRLSSRVLWEFLGTASYNFIKTLKFV